MANDVTEKAKPVRCRKIKKWDTYTQNLNECMAKENYLQAWIAENAGSEIGDTLFPGETKDWIVQLSKKWRSRGLDNQFSLQALNIFCTITEQNPNEVLGASTNACPNTRRLEFLTWNDVAQIVNHINDDTISFCRHNRRFPILIPLICNPKELVLVCLRIGKIVNSNIVTYEMVVYNLPQLCGAGGNVEDIVFTVLAEAIRCDDKNCIFNLLKRYQQAINEFITSDDTSQFDEPLSDVSKIIAILYNGQKPFFEGQFFDYCPETNHYAESKTRTVEDILGQNARQMSTRNER